MKEKTGGQKLGAVLAFVAAALFGAFPIFAQLAYEVGINRPTMLFIRFNGCIVLLWAFILLTGRYQSFPKKAVLKLLLVGALVYSAMSTLNLMAVTMTTASLASLLLCTYPIFVTIISILRKEEILTQNKIWALILSFAGMTLLLQVDFSRISVWGIVCGLGAAIAYTSYIVLGNIIQKGLEPIQSATVIITGACITYTVTGFLGKSLSFDFQPVGWLIMLGMIFFSTVLSIVLFWSSIKLIGPAKTSIIGTVEPLVAVILDVIIFNERMGSLQYLGAFLVMVGVYLIQGYKQGKALELKEGA